VLNNLNELRAGENAIASTRDARAPLIKRFGDGANMTRACALTAMQMPICERGDLGSARLQRAGDRILRSRTFSQHHRMN